ncbi:LOW QUALITY PROTEIN: ankyrin repeat protein [Paramyrothecium foliicola]|nr:LOW QUALITY PROTEIN: ankyrin repeat protein [Paramyrothecium foliicola]
MPRIEDDSADDVSIFIFIELLGIRLRHGPLLKILEAEKPPELTRPYLRPSSISAVDLKENILETENPNAIYLRLAADINDTQSVRWFLHREPPPTADEVAPILAMTLQRKNKAIPLLKAEALTETGRRDPGLQDWVDSLLVASLAHEYDELSQELILRGALYGKPDKYGMTPLHIACLQRSTRKVNFLCRFDTEMNINARDDDGNTPLHIILAGLLSWDEKQANEALWIGDLLVLRGANLHLSNQKGLSPAFFLMRFVAYKPNLVLTGKLGSTKETVNLPDDQGRPLLVVAAASNNTELVKYLLRNGANIEAQDSIGRTALAYAADRGAEDALTKRSIRIGAWLAFIDTLLVIAKVHLSVQFPDFNPRARQEARVHSNISASVDAARRRLEFAEGWVIGMFEAELSKVRERRMDLVKDLFPCTGEVENAIILLIEAKRPLGKLLPIVRSDVALIESQVGQGFLLQNPIEMVMGLEPWKREALAVKVAGCCAPAFVKQEGERSQLMCEWGQPLLLEIRLKFDALNTLKIIIGPMLCAFDCDKQP